jgi:hypothetical protein
MATENKDNVAKPEDAPVVEASTSTDVTVTDAPATVVPPPLPESLKGKTEQEIDEVKQKVVAQRACLGWDPLNGL